MPLYGGNGLRGEEHRGARASTAPWVQPVLQRSQLSSVVHAEGSRTLVILFDAIASKRDSRVWVPIRSQESEICDHPECWFGSLCVSGTACLLPSSPPHLPPVAAECVAVRGRLDSRYWCCSTPADNPSWIRLSSEESQNIHVAGLHGHSASAAVIALRGWLESYFYRCR